MQAIHKSCQMQHVLMNLCRTVMLLLASGKQMCTVQLMQTTLFVCDEYQHLTHSMATTRQSLFLVDHSKFSLDFCWAAMHTGHTFDTQIIQKLTDVSRGCVV